MSVFDNNVRKLQVIGILKGWNVEVDFTHEVISVKHEGKEVIIKGRGFGSLDIKVIKDVIETRFKLLDEKIVSNHKVKKSKRTDFVVFDEVYKDGEDDELED